MKTTDTDNIWAPWRIDYLRSLEKQAAAGSGGGCFLCDYWADAQHDRENLVLWRTQRCMAVFNRFPYTGGHLLIAPSRHGATMEGLDDATLLDLMRLSRDSQAVITRAIKPHGFNVGININRCAGAGLPDHLHLHLVPRWDGDTNFMSVTGDVRVISQSLDDLYDQLKALSEEMKLPTIT